MTTKLDADFQYRLDFISASYAAMSVYKEQKMHAAIARLKNCLRTCDSHVC